MEKSLQSEISSLKCSEHKEAQICFICTAPDCKKRMICHKCLISDLNHNMNHSSKFKDLDTFFTEMKDVSNKDSSMAVMENGYEEIESRKKKITEKIRSIEKSFKTDKLIYFAESRKFIEKTLGFLEVEFKKSLLLLEENLEKCLNQKLSSLKKYEFELENELLRLNVVSNRRNSKVALKKLSSSEIKSNSLKETIETMLFSADGKSRSNEIIDVQLENEGNDINFFNKMRNFLEQDLFMKMQEKTKVYVSDMNSIIKELGEVCFYYYKKTNFYLI